MIINIFVMLDYISLKVKRRLIKVHNMLRNFLKKKFLRGPRGNSGTGNCLVCELFCQGMAQSGNCQDTVESFLLKMSYQWDHLKTEERAVKTDIQSANRTVYQRKTFLYILPTRYNMLIVDSIVIEVTKLFYRWKTWNSNVIQI